MIRNTVRDLRRAILCKSRETLLNIDKGVVHNVEDTSDGYRHLHIINFGPRSHKPNLFARLSIGTKCDTLVPFSGASLIPLEFIYLYHIAINFKYTNGPRGEEGCGCRREMGASSVEQIQEVIKFNENLIQQMTTRRRSLSSSRE